MPYETAELQACGSDPSEGFHIQGAFVRPLLSYNPRTECMERHRIARGFKACADRQEETKLAAKIIKEYTLKLRAGWRPWADDAVIYSDETEYHSIAGILGTRRQDGSHIRRHISKFIEEKRLSVSKKSMETV